MTDTLTLAPPRARAPAPGGCHHCGAPLTRGSPTVTVSGREARVCGDACRTAVETIAGAGGGVWYGLRTHADAHGAVLDPRHRAELEAWRIPEVEAAAVRRADGGASAVTLTVGGMRCAGCAWLVERLLTSIPGVRGAEVDFALGRADVRFEAGAARLPVLLETLADAGYRAAPYTAGAEEDAMESERRARIRSIGVASVFAMQVMLLSAALYAGDHYGMEARFEALFRWLAMVLTAPVLVWPGRTFFTGALAALRARRLTMDVPVALGLSIAFLGSAWATMTGEGAVWFDSVVMFVTLLCIARYLELLARRRATATVRALARSAPLVATRVSDGAAEHIPAAALCPGDRGRVRSGETAPADGVVRSGDSALDESFRARGCALEHVPAAALRPGDRVRVRPGETVPADGVIRSGDSALDESLLTGESAPVARAAGEAVLAGSVNGSGVIEVEVTRTGDATVLGGLLRRAERAARERPEIARLADRAAAWFIAGVLVLAAGVALWWLLHDPARTVPVLVSVLVVTCPCALSLATPAAMTAAFGALARTGLIATRADTIERLALVTYCLADKTGTLTEGRFRLRSVSALADAPEAECLRLAAALERHATHPAGAAIIAGAGGAPADAQGGVGRTATAGAVASRFRGAESPAPPSSAPASGGRVGSMRAGGARSSGEGDVACTGGDEGDEYEVEEVTAQTGGVTGRIGGVRHAIGSAGFVARICGPVPPDASGGGTGGSETHGSPVREEVETHPPSRRRHHILHAREDASGSMGSAARIHAPAFGAFEAGAGEDEAHVLPVCGGAPGRAEPARARAPPPPDASGGGGGAGEGDTHVFLAREGVLLARFTLADTPRAGAKALIEGLHARGIDTTIASGDRPGAVDHAARALGVARRLAGLSPEDKLREADRLAARGERVLMLGDGVNDTPALAGAHVSVAMGRGAAAAAARAGAVLIGDDPRGLLAGLDVARRARRIVRQNLVWAVGYNLVALPLAASGAVPPWAAAVGMSLSSLAVAGNALRLGRARTRGIAR